MMRMTTCLIVFCSFWSAMPQAPLLAQQQTRRSVNTSLYMARFVGVEVDVKLDALDWGGSRSSLILLAGLAFDAHAGDTFAPRLNGMYHVYSPFMPILMTLGPTLRRILPRLQAWSPEILLAHRLRQMPFKLAIRGRAWSDCLKLIISSSEPAGSITRNEQIHFEVAFINLYRGRDHA
jgi:hypothetical protein